jgi:hypothetical protein
MNTEADIREGDESDDSRSRTHRLTINNCRTEQPTPQQHSSLVIYVAGCSRKTDLSGHSRRLTYMLGVLRLFGTIDGTLDVYTYVLLQLIDRLLLFDCHACGICDYKLSDKSLDA